MPPPKKEISHDPVVAAFGRRLKEVRTSRGMTQATLAEKAQVTLSYVTRLERGTSAPGIASLPALPLPWGRRLPTLSRRPLNLTT